MSCIHHIPSVSMWTKYSTKRTQWIKHLSLKKNLLLSCFSLWEKSKEVNRLILWRFFDLKSLWNERFTIPVEFYMYLYCIYYLYLLSFVFSLFPDSIPCITCIRWTCQCKIKFRHHSSKDSQLCLRKITIKFTNFFFFCRCFNDWINKLTLIFLVIYFESILDILLLVLAILTG